MPMMPFRLPDLDAMRHLRERSLAVDTRGLTVMFTPLVRCVLMQPPVGERRRRRGEGAEQGDDKRDQADAGRAMHLANTIGGNSTPPVASV
jgi:hypothetical protein